MAEERERLIKEENRRIRFLRILVDLNLHLVKAGDLPFEEAREIVERLREIAERLFPGKGRVFDIVYRPRFERVFVEIYRDRFQ